MTAQERIELLQAAGEAARQVLLEAGVELEALLLIVEDDEQFGMCSSPFDVRVVERLLTMGVSAVEYARVTHQQPGSQN